MQTSWKIKKTDGCSKAVITKEFNAQSPALMKRTSENFRKSRADRRRPALSASVNLAKSYEDFSQVKKELANVQFTLSQMQIVEETEKFAHKK
ncbi:hypothetical protein Zmor_024130 [Zophobas morio]|uniref:Uncharacterized protein n=1 Tax=Zophobas morio TaxID=2755281 RepID=A0AA38HZI7_9CUCU|nr:hypothetical protein Zmor_024130 [Zophobas morio]